MGDVGDDGAAHLQMVEVEDVDAPVVLDFADRGTHDVVDVGGLGATAPRLGAGEHEQALGVAAHAGREMVELVVVRQHGGVVDVGFELVEQRQLAVDQAPGAAGHRDEDVRHTTAQDLDLLVGDVDECRLHHVEGAGELAELVGPGVLDGGDLGDHGLTAGVAQRTDERGQLDGGHLVGLVRHGAHPAGDGTGEKQRHQARRAGWRRA